MVGELASPAELPAIEDDLYDEEWPEDEIGEPFDPETLQLPFEQDDL